MRVLVTGGGSPGIAGTIHALRNNDDNRDMEIIAADARDDVVGKYLADGFYRIPMASDPNFIDVILEISNKEKIDVILPQVTKELEIFAKNIERFEKNGIRVVVMSYKTLKVANNKYNLMKILDELGYPQGVYELVENKEDLYKYAEKVGYPKERFVVKIPDSSGMRGFRIVTEEKITLEKFKNEKPMNVFAKIEEIASLFDEGPLKLICMEYLPGKEYTVDVYRSPISGRVIVIPRTRDMIRTGITFEGQLVRHEEIIKMSHKLAEHLDMRYCFGFQFKLDRNGKPKILESNPRVQGTMIMSVFGGANMIYWAVKEALGERVNLDNVEIKWGMKFKRYWGGLGIYNEETMKILERK